MFETFYIPATLVALQAELSHRGIPNAFLNKVVDVPVVLQRHCGGSTGFTCAHINNFAPSSQYSYCLKMVEAVLSLVVM